MTARPIFSDNWRWPVRVAVALCLVMVAAGCLGQPGAGQKITSDTMTPVYRTTSTTVPTPVPENPPVSVSGPRTEFSVGDIRSTLKFWNDTMNWNLSPARIEAYAVSMENGVLKKYRTNPDYPNLLNIPDKQQFRREAGIALGFTESESEEFVRALQQYDRDEWGMLDCRDYVNNSPCPQRTITINFSVKPNP